MGVLAPWRVLLRPRSVAGPGMTQRSIVPVSAWHQGRVSVARSTTRRGAGLGNELIALAKAYIGARELDLRLTLPRWTTNRYGLGPQLGWRRGSLLLSEVSRRLPSFVVTEELYRSTGEVDYAAALRHLAARHDLFERRRLALLHEGMWGGYPAIRSARSFVTRTVLGAPGVAEHLDSLGLPSHESLVLGVHIRAGDFSRTQVERGSWNRVVPTAWYRQAIQAVLGLLDGLPCRCLLVSDAEPEALADLLSLPGTEMASSTSPVADVAVLGAADVLVCSTSSFSMTAAFISHAPYLWYEPQLTHARRGLVMWAEGRDDDRAGGVGRGIPFDGESRLPDDLASLLAAEGRLRELAHDLLYDGVVSPPVTGASSTEK
jgi:hypothetical protein